MDGPAEYFLPVTGEAQTRLAGKGDDKDSATVGAGVASETVAVTSTGDELADFPDGRAGERAVLLSEKLPVHGTKALPVTLPDVFVEGKPVEAGFVGLFFVMR